MTEFDNLFDDSGDLKVGQESMAELQSQIALKEYYDELIKTLELKDKQKKQYRLRDLFKIWTDPAVLYRFAVTAGKLTAFGLFSQMMEDAGIVKITQEADNLSEMEMLGKLMNVGLLNNQNAAALIMYFVSNMIEDAYKNLLTPKQSTVKSIRELLWFSVHAVPLGLSAVLIYPFVTTTTRVTMQTDIAIQFREMLQDGQFSELRPDEHTALVEMTRDDTPLLTAADLIGLATEDAATIGFALYNLGIAGAVKTSLTIGQQGGQLVAQAAPELLNSTRIDHAVDISDKITVARQALNTVNVATSAPSALVPAVLKLSTVSAAVLSLAKTPNASVATTAALSTLMVVYDYAVNTGHQTLADTMNGYVVDILSTVSSYLASWYV